MAQTIESQYGKKTETYTRQCGENRLYADATNDVPQQQSAQHKGNSLRIGN